MKRFKRTKSRTPRSKKRPVTIAQADAILSLAASAPMLVQGAESAAILSLLAKDLQAASLQACDSDTFNAIPQTPIVPPVPQSNINSMNQSNSETYSPPH